MATPFSFPGFSDAEWFCLIGERHGNRTGYGQLLTDQANDLLLYTLHQQGRMFPAMPKQMLSFPQGTTIKAFIASHSPHELHFYERDMVTDELAERAGLAPLIKKLRTMQVGFVGNPALKKLDVFPIHRFYATDPNDFHLNRKGMQGVVRQIMKDRDCDIYLFSSGISAACIIGMLHGKLRATLFDCGSIWDAFIGIGGQREWRSRLYSDEKLLSNWKEKNKPIP
jgi:hypothetical protein